MNREGNDNKNKSAVLAECCLKFVLCLWISLSLQLHPGPVSLPLTPSLLNLLIFFFVFQAIIDVIHPTKSDESGEMADDEDDDDDDDDYVTESEEEVDVDGGEDEPFVVSDVTESSLQLEVQVS